MIFLRRCIIAIIAISFAFRPLELIAENKNLDTNPDNPKEEMITDQEQLKTEVKSSEQYQGLIFGEVKIVIKDIFDPPDNTLFRTVNNLKITTRQQVISQELLFKAGEPYDRFLVSESERVLRTLKYLRDVKIKEVKKGSIVDIIVEVQDTWTIIPQASYSSGDGRKRRSIGLSEGNLLGMGKRIEALYKEDDATDSLQFAYDDRRLFGSKYQGQLALLEGSDGNSIFYDLGLPYRSLVQKEAYGHSVLAGDTIERLYAASEERYIFRKQFEEFNGYFSFSTGEPSSAVKRFTFGARYISERFHEATQEDYEDIDFDPEELPENGGQLADNRRFAGPTLGYEYIEEDYIKSRYIDRFARYEDFNLGNRLRLQTTIAPEFLGSITDTLMLRGSFGSGARVSHDGFFRWEFGSNTRVNEDGFDNSIFGIEGQYYKRIGPLKLAGTSLGNHTLAARAILDYAKDLDYDREFLVGGDNYLRGYKARTFTGDKRFAVNLEDRIHLVENLYDLVSVGAAVFAEAGGATFSPLPDLFQNELYADVGFGLRLAFPRSSGERILRLDIAFPLREGDDGSDAFQSRAIFSGGQLFTSQLPTESFDSNRVGIDFGP